MNSEFVESEYVRAWVEDGILIADFKELEIITLPAAKSMVTTRKLLSNGRSLPILLDFSKVNSATRDSLSFLATKESTEGISKGAFVVSSSLARLVFNFFMLLHNPGPPSRMFPSRIEALDWLKKSD